MNAQTLNTEPDLTISDLQKEKKVCRATVTNWMRAGLIEYKKLGGKAVRFSRDAVRAFDARHTVKASAA